MNGTREPRGQRAEQSAVSRDVSPALTEHERKERAMTAGSFNQGGTAGFPSLEDRNLLFLYRFLV